jgi:hypothetical protein
MQPNFGLMSKIQNQKEKDAAEQALETMDENYVGLNYDLEV